MCGLYIKRIFFSYLLDMEIFYYFDCCFPTVYLVNGVFFENVSALKSAPGDSLYITLLPLDAVYLPYTVRVGGSEIYANSALCKLYKLPGGRVYVRFLPRFNYVYSPVRHDVKPTSPSAAKRMFDAVKAANIPAVRSLLTPALSASVDDNSLLEFFDGYSDVLENNGYVPAGKDTFFLIPDDGSTATLFKAEFKDGLIDNISEVRS